MSAELETAGQLFARGLQRHIEKDWGAAEKLYREALALAPGRQSVVFNLGRLMLEQKRYREAEDFFVQSLRLDAGDHEACCSLGIVQVRQGRFQEALAQFDRALVLRPEDAGAHAGRGHALAGLGQYERALESHARCLDLQPEAAEYQENFARCAEFALIRSAELRPERLEGAVRACLAGGHVEYQSLALVASMLMGRKHEGIMLRFGHSGFDLAAVHAASPDDLGGFLGDPLLLSILEKILVTEDADEAFFAGMRGGLLRLAMREAGGAALRGLAGPLAFSLACQCFLNEYVWSVTDEEARLADRLASRCAAGLADGTTPDFELGVLGCYRPLHKVPGIAQWCDGNPGRIGGGFARLVERQVLEPRAEAAIAARLGRIGPVVDPVSLAVQAQYEENPYPRWTVLRKTVPVPYLDWIARVIAPNWLEPEEAATHPRILIAGCGTGREALSCAQAFVNARCMAIDLSAASLAYARRQAEALGIRNVDFFQGDILALDERESFDLVSCSGVLHHMADPEAGLQRLLRALRPGGYLMLALYSELARQDIVRVRALIAEHRLEPSLRGIRACRELLRDRGGGSLQSIMEDTRDFYSASMTRDLLFHVQEHRYTIPQIGAMLTRNHLEFFGFCTPDPKVRKLYGSAYPGDPRMLDLDNWDALERAHPRLFRAMYQFCARKRRAGWRRS